ncbi:hypothetical protein [Streptomyces cellostaticus]|uniref:hypothetical protein n=1 Tax=Streptomyces cellostaticus TaxID=67285 RepID=UPI002025C3B7|nr:hypothetical protein [Streptomyces cellostaticus]
MTAKVPLKETALNAERITRISEVHGVCPEFDAEGFEVSVMADLPRLELSARIARTSQGLHDHLPVGGTDALDVLLRSLPPTPAAAGVTNDFGLHIYRPHSDHVSRYLRTAEQLDRSLAALARMTGYFSAELPVRHFLADFPDETMKAVDAWSRDEDFRVRRLASEATRPLLPWAPRIALPAGAGLPVLETLYDDPHLYVRTSVANHLGDIAATQPELVLDTLHRWKASGRVTGEQFAFLARNALLNRLTEGWPPAYALLGYPHDAPIALTPLILQRTELRDGDTQDSSAALTATATTPVHVMLVIATTGPSGRPREKGGLRAPRHCRAGPGTTARQGAPAALDRTLEGLPRLLLPRPSGQRPPLPRGRLHRPRLLTARPPFQPRPPAQAAAVRRGPGSCCPQPPEGVIRPDRTSLNGDIPELARLNPGTRTHVHRMPSEQAVTGPDPPRFLEHQCHTDAQTEDSMHPTLTSLQQPPGIERRPGWPMHSVDGTPSSERPDTGWAA